VRPQAATAVSVHGYSRQLHLLSGPTNAMPTAVVVDFSGLQASKPSSPKQFDHTFLVNADDPLLEQGGASSRPRAALDLRVMANVGMEASAELVLGWANALFGRTRNSGRALLLEGRSPQNEKNAACFEGDSRLFQAAADKLMGLPASGHHWALFQALLVEGDAFLLIGVWRSATLGALAEGPAVAGLRKAAKPTRCSGRSAGVALRFALAGALRNERQ